MKKFLLLLLLPSLIYPQEWIDKMQDPNNNFYDTQRDFNEYWEDKTIEKGKGWKQFKRWENFIEPRVFPDGIQQPEILFKEFNALLQANNQFLMLPPNTWEQVGPDNVPLESSGRKRGIGRVNTIAFHPSDPDIIYIGAPAGGFWKSLNNGQTWTTTTDFLTNLGVSDIAINPANPDEIYIVTGDRDGGDTYSYGLMKSTDGGNTFNTTGLSFNITNYYRGNRVLIDPSATNTIIVATSNGIYRSIDAGVSFTHTYSGINMTDIEFHPTNTNIIYGASKGNTSIYKSSDNGITWNQSGTGLPATGQVVRACVAVTPSNDQIVYALFGDNNNGFYGVYKSNNEGATWSQQSNSPNLLGWQVDGSDSDGQAWYDLALSVSPTDENVLFVGGVNTWKSTNGGISWDINTHWYGASGNTYMHADEHMLKYNPLNNHIYSGNDGGLYYSDNNGNDWTDISDGLHITQFYSLGVSQTVQNKVITGSQDNGTFLKENLNWDAVIGGDGMECIIDYTNSNIMYGEVYYGSVRKSTNGGNSFSSISSGNGAWETPYELDKNDPNIIYIGYDELRKSTDGGNSWSWITNGETNGGKIDEIGISKSNQNVIYFSDGPNIFRTTDGGNNWNSINNNLPYKYISYIIVHPSDENKVWVTLSGYTAGEKVYKSIDGGNNWINISGTLPNIPVNCIELDKTNNLETVYIGTDLGVFSTDSTLNDWNMFNNNSLPNVIVNELEIQYQSNKLFAATYGRGLWSIDLEITSPPIAGFSYNDSIFCNIPADVTFLNNSYYSNSYYWDFGDGNTSTATNPTHTYSSYGTFTVQLIATGPLGADSIIQQDIISIDQSNPCIITLPVSGSGVTQTQCNGTLYDVGGPSGNYFDENDCWITIAPPGSNQITLTFNSFDIEAPSSSTNCNWDYLEIFDGDDLSAPSLGQYCNVLTGSPGVIVSSGGAITVLLHSDQAVNGAGFEADWTCSFPSSPPVTAFEISDSVSCYSTISFTDISTNGPTTWEWDFGDGNTSNMQNPVHTYSSSGTYTVKLTTSNQYGSDSLIINNAITIIDVTLQTNGATACGDTSVTLTATSSDGIVYWYDDSSLLNIVGTGNSFITPVINTTTSYYAQAVYEFGSIYGGPADNSIGSGGYFQGERHLVFDNYTPSKLVSVLVYTNSDGYRTIELRNSSNAVLADTTVFIPTSNSGIRINLDFDLPVENNMQLGLNGPNNDMYRTSSGAVFPYNISNIVSITGTNAPAGYYYHFYDWEIQNAPCVSNAEEVIANIDSNSTNSTTITSCGAYTWVVNNVTYSSSGTYTDITTDSAGCTHTEILILTIDNNTSNTNNLTECELYTWPVTGNIYTTSGTYTDTSISSSGCTHIETLVLTIEYNTANTTIVEECLTFTWPVNGQTYTSTGTYVDINTMPSGCTHTETLNLTIVECGCTDPLANNYNPLAVIDDSSCCYLNIDQNDTIICIGESITLSINGGTSNMQQACNINDLPVNLQNGLTAYYPFCGNGDDISINSRDLTNSGATLTTDRHGNPDNAYYFDGNDFLYNEPSSYFPTNITSYSFAAWFEKIGSAGAICHQNGLKLTNLLEIGSFGLEGNVTARHRAGNSNPFYLHGGSGISPSGWQHAVSTWDGNNVKIYVNGIFIADTTLPATVPFLPHFRIGSVPYTNISATGNWSSGYYNGNIDEVGVWNRVLSDSEIQQLYNQNTSCLWSNGDTTTSITVNPTQTTTYWVTHNGCTDSITVTVSDTSSSVNTINTCDSTIWNGTIYDSTGIYTFNTTNSLGCDSTAVLNLTINYNTTNTYTETICNSYTWPIDSNIYDTSGTYTVVSTNSSGCIHTEILYLTINNNESNSNFIAACDEYLWPIDSNTYYSSGTYVNIGTNAFGCVKIDTLELTIDSSLNITQNLSICENDSVIIGTNIYNTPGSYIDVLQALNGCDSTINTILTVFPNINNNQNLSICAGDSIIVGQNVYYDQGIYTDTFTSNIGCDSIIMTEIEVNEIDINFSFNGTTLTASAIGGYAPYSFEIGNQNGAILNSSNVLGNNSVSINPIENGTYYCFVIDENGCISDTGFYEIDIFHTSLGQVSNPNISIYPNPTTGLINVLFLNKSTSTLSIQNILGEDIYQSVVTETGEINKEIDLSNFANGIYILELDTEYGIINQKIVVE